MPSVGAALGFSASQLLQLQFQLAIGRCMCVRTAQWKVVDFGAFSVERRHVVVWFSFLASLTSVEDGRVLIASRRRRIISLIFGRPMRAFTVLTQPLGSSRTTSKRVSRPLFPLGGRYFRPIHLIGSSFVNATMSPSPVQVAPRPSVSATLLYTRYCCARARPSPGFVLPSLVLILLLYTPSPHMRPYTSGVVMDISPRIISVHYIRIHFGYEPGTHIQNALREKEERIYLSCPTEIARLHRIRIPDMRARIQGYILS